MQFCFVLFILRHVHFYCMPGVQCIQLCNPLEKCRRVIILGCISHMIFAVYRVIFLYYLFPWWCLLIIGVGTFACRHYEQSRTRRTSFDIVIFPANSGSPPKWQIICRYVSFFFIFRIIKRFVSAAVRIVSKYCRLAPKQVVHSLMAYSGFFYRFSSIHIVDYNVFSVIYERGRTV